MKTTEGSDRSRKGDGGIHVERGERQDPCCCLGFAAAQRGISMQESQNSLPTTGIHFPKEGAWGSGIKTLKWFSTVREQVISAVKAGQGTWIAEGHCWVLRNFQLWKRFWASSLYTVLVLTVHRADGCCPELISVRSGWETPGADVASGSMRQWWTWQCWLMVETQ